MVNDHSDSETKPAAAIPWDTDMVVHTTSFDYTSCGLLAELINSTIDPPRGIDLWILRTLNEFSIIELRPVPTK